MITNKTLSKWNLTHQVKCYTGTLIVVQIERKVKSQPILPTGCFERTTITFLTCTTISLTSLKALAQQCHLTHGGSGPLAD
jgi:hypothetical protein